MDKRGQGGLSSLDTNEALAQATLHFQKGSYAAAAEQYTSCLNKSPANRPKEHKISIIYNRATCHLKLKDYDKLLKDCDAILKLDSNNIKVYSRKVKALCSLGRFIDAFSVAQHWTQVAPENPQAKKEHDRLNRIVTALQEQEDDGLEESLDDAGVPLVSAADAAASGATMCHGAEAAAEVMVEANGAAGINSGGATGGNEGRGPSSFRCSPCDIMFSTRQELHVHCSSELHRKKASHEEEGGWKYRPPPRGLTSREYSKCPRYFGEGMCRFGSRCSQAHSERELDEWKERFEQKKEKLQLAKDKDEAANNYAEQLLKSWINSDNRESVMTEILEGVNVHVGCDLSVTMSTKRCTHVWMFTVTSKMCLRRVALLDDATRRHFNIASVTVGPKKSQKSQSITENCQQWTNPSFCSSKQNVDKVYRIKVGFKTDIYGALRQTVIFDFGSEPVLTRQLSVDSKPVSDLDVASLDLKLDETGRWDLSTKTIVPFTPSPHLKEEEAEELLQRYPPPMETSFTVSEALLEPTLLPHLYKTRMHDLLYIEEMAQFSSISKFNVKTTVQMVDRFMLTPSTVTVAKFAQCGELFAQMRLVSDISEDTAQGRLILQNVSTVYLAPYDPKQEERDGRTQDPVKVYEAVVEEKGKNFIFIRLSAQCVRELNLTKDQELSTQVQFQLNRLPLCEMHDAVDRLPSEHFVFPDIVRSDHHIPWNPQRQWSDKQDNRLNSKQKEAIVAITTEREHHLPPILIVGPYGTGKTFTLAQATKQILRQPGTKVLICTHSNSAADLYIKDYFHPYVEEGHPEARPLRIYYRQRWTNTVHPTVFEYCLVMNRGTPQVQFFRPTREDIESHRIIVCTLSTARYLYDLGLGEDCFSHILLDESAQAMECETIMPLAIAGLNTRVVLAGDHMQLSPEVHSDFARDRNLHVSLLERMYDLYPYTNPCRILLCENYRSHKAVLDYTSELFYDNKLIASGSQPRHELFYPLSFFTARGEDLQHQNSTTFYNNSEVYELVERVSELSKMWPKSWGPIDDNGIGVVSPYSDQVIRIRAELRKRKLYNVSVERVMNVQGKQFRAIFLSTVRTRHTCSSDDSLEDYIDYGFLSNVKLLNTAITRAQSLVAVVGDPISLCTIGKCRKLWERFIEICNRNNSLHGITWNVLRSQLDGVELKKTYVLNPLAPEFIPNRLRHACYSAPEPVGFGKYGYTFTSQSPRPNWVPRPHGPYFPPHHQMGMYYPQPMMPMQYMPPYPHQGPHMPRPMQSWGPPPPPLPPQNRNTNHALPSPAAANLTGTPIQLPVTSQNTSHKSTSTSAAGNSSDNSTSPSGSQPSKVVAIPKSKGHDPHMTTSMHNGSPLGTPVSMMQQQQPMGGPRVGYQQAGPRFPFFPSAHLVPQVYAMGPPHYMVPQHPPRPHQPSPTGPPMGPHNHLLGAPIGPHQMPGPPPSGAMPPGGGVSPGTSTNANTPSPISPLQNWPTLPSSSANNNNNPERPRSSSTSSSKSPLTTDTNHNVQILPNVCNASTEVKNMMESGHRSNVNQQQSMENGFKNPFNIDPKLLLQNIFLQRELCNYIQQTQGIPAAQNFMRSLELQQIQQHQKQLQQYGQPPPLPPQQRSKYSRYQGAPEELRSGRNQHIEFLQKRHVQHETVSVKRDEPSAYDNNNKQTQDSTGKFPSEGFGAYSSNTTNGHTASRGIQETGTQRFAGSFNRSGYTQAKSGEDYTMVSSRLAGPVSTGQQEVQNRLSATAEVGATATARGQPGWDEMPNGVNQDVPFSHSSYRKRYHSAGTGRIPLPHTQAASQQLSLGALAINNNNVASNASHPQGELMSDHMGHMVRYIEDSLEDKYHESELGNIHIGHNPLKLSLSAPGGSLGQPSGSEGHAPLYLRRSSNSSTPQPTSSRNMSYAGALRSQPPQPLPEPESENPLDLLKNLNIKASPGTQAFYQYFS